MLVFEERGKLEHQAKNLLKQGQEPTTKSTHIRCMTPSPGFEPRVTLVGVLSPLCYPCSPSLVLLHAVSIVTGLFQVWSSVNSSYRSPYIVNVEKLSLKHSEFSACLNVSLFGHSCNKVAEAKIASNEPLTTSVTCLCKLEHILGNFTSGTMLLSLWGFWGKLNRQMSFFTWLVTAKANVQNFSVWISLW